jgi:5,5'-dehydrodivanillate O-demethylase oxygenase subunit
MLTQLENERLTRVGPGTPMGELFRRYWQPVAASADLSADPVKQIRILGETLVLFRDRQGRLGLIGERCPHRGTAMVYGIPEPDGLRCPYHGWLYDRAGQCLERPDRRHPEEVRGDPSAAMTSYPVEELGGLVFAYLGPAPAPLLPRWDVFLKEDVLRSIGSAVVPCNWLQCMENGLDEGHVEWLHGYFGNYMLERQGRPDLQTRVRPHKIFHFERFEFGLLQTHAGTDDPPSPTIFPNVTASGRWLFRVPIDDTHTWAIQYRAHRLPAGVEAQPQDPVPVYELPLPGLDEHEQVNWPLMDVAGGQDMLMWFARGPIADRSAEELDPDIDAGLILHRQLLEENMQKVARGEDPIGVIRDPLKNVRIRLPGQDQEEAQVPRAERPAGAARHYVAPPDRFDPVVAQLKQLTAELARA